MLCDKLNTIWGKATLSNGYYMIQSGEYKHEYLHRLIWENFNGTKVPEGFVIHHLNGDKKDNCIMNLELMSDGLHRSFHAIGNLSFTKKKSDENSSGYYRVIKQKDETCKQGFIWRYRYFDENGDRKSLMNVDIKELEKRVKAQGLEWYKL